MKKGYEQAEPLLSEILNNLKKGQLQAVKGFQEKGKSSKAFGNHRLYWTPGKKYLVRCKENAEEVFVFPYDPQKEEAILDDSGKRFQLNEEEEVRAFLEYIKYMHYQGHTVTNGSLE